jgi:hypothetical protein
VAEALVPAIAAHCGAARATGPGRGAGAAERCDGALAGVGALERIEAVTGQLAKTLKPAAWALV